MNVEEKDLKSQITPEVAEKKVSEAVEDVVEDDFLIEDDGDFFWVIQRVAWGTIKSLMVIVVLGLLVWLIWGGSIPFIGGGDKEPKEEPIKIEIQKEPASDEPGFFGRLFSKSKEDAEKVVEIVKEKVPEINEVIPPSNEPTVRNSLNIESLAFSLANDNVNFTSGTTITETTSWLRQVKIVGDISTQLIRQTDPSIRADRIEETIRAAEDLLNQSSGLQRKLSQELNFFGQRGAQANEAIGALDKQISQSLGQFEGKKVEDLLDQKIEAQKRASENLAEAKVRQTLLKNVQNFDRLLRQKSIPLLQPTEIRASST